MPPAIIGAAATIGGALIAGDAAKGAARAQVRGQERAASAATAAEERAFLIEQEGLTSALASFEEDVSGLEDLFDSPESFLSQFLAIADDPSEDFGFSEAVAAGARDVSTTLAASGLFGSGANIEQQSQNVVKQSGIRANIVAQNRAQKLQAVGQLSNIAQARSSQRLSTATTRADLIGRGGVVGGLGELTRQRDEKAASGASPLGSGFRSSGGLSNAQHAAALANERRRRGLS